MKRNLKSVAIAVGLIIIVGAILFFGAELGAGNYGYVEQYKFGVNKKDLSDAIENFKSKNIDFIPPIKYEAIDSLDTITKQFSAYVYFSDEDMVLCFFIDASSDDGNGAYINLLSVNQVLRDPVYKLINKDFDRRENLKIKKEFEERVLNKLNLKYNDKGNPNFIFWK